MIGYPDIPPPRDGERRDRLDTVVRRTSASSALAAALRAEATLVARPVLRRLGRRGPAGFPLSLALGFVVLLMWLLVHASPGRLLVDRCCSEEAGYPLGAALLRLPGSMLAPAHNLPVWGALAQVVLVFAVGEALVGWRRALAVGIVGHVVATLSARVLIWLGPAALLGLTRADLYLLDTGPSAATVALAVYLALAFRTPLLGTIISAAMALEVVLKPNLAGREHLVAIAVGALAAWWARTHRRYGSAGTISPNGLRVPVKNGISTLVCSRAFDPRRWRTRSTIRWSSSASKASSHS